MNVCGYVRVSSDGQTENYSIPQQQKAIRSYCKLKAGTWLKNDVPQEPELSFEDAKKIFKNAKKIFKNAKKIFKDAKKIFEDAKNNFTDTFTVEQQRAILHSLIKKIVLQGDEMQIYWRFE